MATVTLKHPAPVSELCLRPARLPDCRPFFGQDVSMGDMLDLLAGLSGQPRSVIDELDVADLPAIFAAMEDCLSV